jgi:hypothetical protein
LLGQPIERGSLHFSVLQSYDYQNNDVYTTGSQSFDAMLATTRPLSSTYRLTLAGWGGLTVLGAVDSLPLGVDERPEEEEAGDAGQGVSEGPRFYDYGPGSNFGGNATLTRDGRIFAAFLYEGRHLYSLDGVRANHFLQRLRADFMVPLRGPLGFGVSGEYFDRRTFYQDEAGTIRRHHYPQVRAYFTWSPS